VQPEPWHLSHAQLAQAALAQYSADVLREALQAAPVAARAAIDRRLPEILARYVLNVDAPPMDALIAVVAARPA
jgi:hypothetical protein